MVEMREKENGLYEATYVPDDEVYLTEKERKRCSLTGLGIALWCFISCRIMLKPVLFVILKFLRICLAFTRLSIHYGSSGLNVSPENPLDILLNYTYGNPMP